MAILTLLSPALHPCLLVAQGVPQFKWGNNRMGKVNLGLSRADLRSPCSRPPLRYGKRVRRNHLTIGADNKVQVTRVMSSGSTSSNKSEKVTPSAGGRTREELKKLVMRAVTNTNRGKRATAEQRQSIFSLLLDLEAYNPTADPINSPAISGCWALLYTAPIDEKTSDKFAGTEEGPFLSRVKPASLGAVRQSRSFQVIDAERGVAENIAEFTFFGREGSLTIYGSVVKSAATEKGAVRVDVTFDSFILKIGSVTFPSVSLSWISPKGWIETTYLDENFRIGRGDKGSIFVAARAKQS